MRSIADQPERGGDLLGGDRKGEDRGMAIVGLFLLQGRDSREPLVVPDDCTLPATVFPLPPPRRPEALPDQSSPIY